MKKKAPLLILFLLATLFTSAQSFYLESKIPADSQVVASINGDRTLELLSINDFEKSDIGKLFLKQLKKGNSTIESVKDFGFKLNSKAYYFHQTNDSISSHNFIVQIANKGNFEKQLLQGGKKNIELLNGTSILQQHGTITAWNNEILVISSSQLSKSYFDTNKQRLKLQKITEEESTWELKKRLKTEWTRTQTLKLLTEKPTRSILTNKSYISSKNNKASASVWVNNYGELMNVFLQGNLKSFRNLGITTFKDMYGINSVNANLFFNETSVELKTTMHVNQQWSNSFKEIYNKKPHKKFNKYFNKDNTLAYMNLTLSTEGLLKSYPSLIADTYGNIIPAYSQETKLAAEFFNLLLDEQAIDELIGGDFLFVLNDLKQKEVSYLSYDYDENYKKKEVKKTKKEFVPDFTFMIGSENEQFVKKLLRIGIKHNYVDNLSSYYSLVLPKKLPINLFVGIKDDIVFLTSSEKQIQQIMDGSIISNIGKHKKAFAKNAMTVYINGTEIAKRIPQEMYRSNATLDSFMTKICTNNLEAQLSTSKFKNNKIHTSLKINTPEKKGNSLQFFFNMVNEIVSKK